MPTTYESTLRSQLATDAATVIDTWGEAVTRRLLGAAGTTETINAVVDQDKETESQPDDYERPEGQQIRREIMLEVLATQDIDRRDTFVIGADGGEVWSVRRIRSRDDGMKTVYLVLVEGQTSRMTRNRPT